MPRIFLCSTFAGSLLLLLAACSGGGGSSGDAAPASDIAWPLNPATVRSLVGGELPAFSRADVGPNVDRLIRAADSLLLSDLLVFVNVGSPSRGKSFCSGAECTSSFLATGLSLTFSDLDFRGSGIEYQAVSSHRGVSLAQGRGKGRIAGTSFDYFGYGGWLEHSFFISETDEINGGILQGTAFGHSYSVGDATGTNPIAEGGSGTWTGVVVGADVSATVARGHKIQGDAEITIADFADPMVSISFTNISDLDDHSQRADITWSALPVTDGGFKTGSEGNVIEGKFYGPTHEEAGGVFEHSQILGAFGATRQ